LPGTWAMIVTVIGGQVALAGLLFGALKLSGAHSPTQKGRHSRRSSTPATSAAPAAIAKGAPAKWTGRAGDVKA
jgi:hypothetical protein